MKNKEVFHIRTKENIAAGKKWMFDLYAHWYGLKKEEPEPGTTSDWMEFIRREKERVEKSKIGGPR
jgi:hypothetical protein